MTNTRQTPATPTDHPPTPTPDTQPSPAARAAAAPDKEALREALRQVQTPEQARAIIGALLSEADDKPATEVQQREGETPPGYHRVQETAERIGTDKTAALLLEAAREVITSEGEVREALEQAFQETTNPARQQAETDPELRRPLSLLHGALIEHMQPLQALDTRVFLAINHLPHPRVANQVMYSLTSVMNGGGGWLLGLLLAALLDQPRGRVALRQVVTPLWFATMAVEYPIKAYFRRRRPFIDVVQAISVGRKPGGYSFPSGHSASAFAGAWLISRHYPDLTLLWYTIAATVGFSRIYLGVHYPGDVVSGALAGTVIAEVVRQVVDAEAPDAC
jgi:undecaprenyl-diphosphatase